MLMLLLAVFAGALAVSALAVPGVLMLAPRLGLLDQPGVRKVHARTTPMGGGIAIWLGVAIPTFVLASLVMFPGVVSVASIQILRDSVAFSPGRAQQLLAIVVGGTALFVLGLVDDRWNLSWKIRLGLQLLIALAVALAGVRATVFVSQPWFGITITVIWIIVLTNAMNFLDNMDALSAGIGLIASLVFAAILVLMVRSTAWSVAAAFLALAGALAGFLIWNRPPAALFMGDSGSNLIGFLLATLTVVGTFYEANSSRHVILAPVCVLAIPLYDFCSVILIRFSEGRSPFHGDKSHFSHRLVELGFRQSRAVLTIHLATLMTGLGGLLLYEVADWTGALLVMALILCVLAVIALVETVARRSVNDMQDSLAAVQADSSVPGEPGASIHVKADSGDRIE